MNILHSISNWYFTKKALPYWCILLFDCALVAFSGYVGYYIDLGGDVFAGNFWRITLALLVSLVPFILFFRLLHTYSGILRYSSFVDLQRVAIASLAGTSVSWVIGRLGGLVFPAQEVRHSCSRLSRQPSTCLSAALCSWVLNALW